MTQTYFLGANSKNGFASLYDGFPPDEGVFLHIIKGGPGTGKSSFMRRIGRAAQERGMDVHYVLCSGDPDSLDGVYLPALRAAWVDGTAPHAAEPRRFGVDSDYVNLGHFCRLPFTAADAEKISHISRTYKALYGEAYRYLSAAADLGKAGKPSALPEPAVLAEIDSLLQPSGKTGARSRRFLHALTCQGDVRLNGEIQKLCKQVVQVDGQAALTYISRSCRETAILCPSPLDPETLEAILLPERSLAFVDSGWLLPVWRSLVPATPVLAAEAETRQLRERCLALAFDKLRRAKALHDEMEAIYKRYMDFPALTAYTDILLAELFR